MLLPVVPQLSRRVSQKPLNGSRVLLCMVGPTFYILRKVVLCTEYVRALQVTAQVYESAQLIRSHCLFHHHGPRVVNNRGWRQGPRIYGSMLHADYCRKDLQPQEKEAFPLLSFFFFSFFFFSLFLNKFRTFCRVI